MTQQVPTKTLARPRPDEQREARPSLTSFVQTLLDGIRGRAGWKAEALGTAVFFVLYMVWFANLEQSTAHFHVMHSVLDDHIPFTEVFVLPYLAWFIFMPVTLVYLFAFAGETFRKTALFLAIGMVCSLVIFTLWPTMQDLRPLEMPRDNVFTDWIATIYQADTPTNVSPSIHALNTLGIQFGILHCDRLRRRPGIQIGTAVLSVLIIASTVMIKQHSILDVLAAFALAIPLYLITFGPEAPRRILRALSGAKSQSLDPVARVAQQP